ncbi:MAG TPA: enoyl-CoA hydratase/isomerase family protein [Limnochordales bacterium]
MGAPPDSEQQAPLAFVRDGPVAWVVFQRPQARNALTWEMYEGLWEACEQVDRDPELKALVLRGSGGHFAAGTDIHQFLEFSGAQDGIEYERRLDRIVDRLERVRKPTLAAIEGVAAGGGLALALACDLRYCSPDARLGVPIARTLGNCLSAANYARLVDMVGPGRAKELLMRARLVGAEEAERWGLVNGVVPAAELYQRVREVAVELASHAPITLRVTKEAIRRVQEWRRQIQADDLIAEAYGSEDFQEGVRAFVARRPPTFRGR